MKQEFWIDATAVSRARRMLFLFLVNWGLLGWVAVVAGRENRVIGGVALALGLIVFLAALTQLRTTRYAGRLPLIVLDEEGVGYRYPAEGSMRRAAWSELVGRNREEERSGLVKLQENSGREVLLAVGSLSEKDRATLEAELDRRFPVKRGSG